MGSSLSLQSCPVESKIQKDFWIQDLQASFGVVTAKQGWASGPGLKGDADGMALPSPAFAVFFFFSSDSIFEQDSKTNRAQSETPFSKHLEGFAWHFQVVTKSEPFPC